MVRLLSRHLITYPNNFQTVIRSLQLDSILCAGFSVKSDANGGEIKKGVHPSPTTEEVSLCYFTITEPPV